MPPDELATRETLLLRLRDPDDSDSWREFSELYTPLLYRFCLKRGITPDDAADIVQDVMRSISLAMPGFEYDPGKGKFKSWLFTAVRNATRRHFRNLSRRPITAAETKMLQRIEETPDEREVRDWDCEYHREMLAWAMDKVRPEFAERIWRAFELTALEERSQQEAADELRMTKNAVGIAKFKVLKRLREKVQSVAADRWEDDFARTDQNSGNLGGSTD